MKLYRRFEAAKPRDKIGKADLRLLEECRTARLETLSVALALPRLATPASVSLQKEFLDLVASECPNLNSLKLVLHLQDQFHGNQDLTSSSLFSHPLVEHLELHLACPTEARVTFGSHRNDVTFFSSMTSSLTSLRTLTLESSGTGAHLERPLFICSPSLLVLRVDKPFDSSQTSTDVLLVCPQLCQFYFKAHTIIQSPGQKPVMSIEQRICTPFQGWYPVAEECEAFMHVESQLEKWNTLITYSWPNFLAWLG